MAHHRRRYLLLLVPIFLAMACRDSTQFTTISESQALRRVVQLLNHPRADQAGFTEADTSDFCAAEPSGSLTVVCYEGLVTQLHVTTTVEGEASRNFSTHTLFASLANLPGLKVLTLASLGLWGPLPGSVGRLSSLEILNVSSNRLSGDIPVQLLHLRNLHTLVLDRNAFTGRVPFWVNALSSLTVLSLGHNSLRGSLPDSVGKLRNLRALVLSGNNLSGRVPNLGKLTNLQILDLQGNKFGPHFPVLPRKLVALVLSNNRLIVN